MAGKVFICEETRIVSALLQHFVHAGDVVADGVGCTESWCQQCDSGQVTISYHGLRAITE
jgi:hypothetical protein